MTLVKGRAVPVSEFYINKSTEMKFAAYILTLILPDLRSNVAHAVLIMMIFIVKTVWMIYIPVWICLIRSGIKGVIDINLFVNSNINYPISPCTRRCFNT